MQNYKKNLKKFIDRKYKNCTVRIVILLKII